MNLIFAKQQLLLVRNLSGLALPSNEDLLSLNFRPSVIRVAEVNRLGQIAVEQIHSHSRLELVSLRQALDCFDPIQAAAIIHAQQIIHYQNTHQFCSSCGSTTEFNRLSNWLHCPICQTDIYPRISPAMIVAVRKGDKLLMAQANHFAPQVWSVLAGFCEVGESLEQTVEREVFEEVGLKVSNIRYWGSQYWPFPNSLMVAFTADYASGEIVLDRTEMRAAGFYSKDQLPGRPASNLSIANRLIEDFILAG